jgi:hypothetical protein
MGITYFVVSVIGVLLGTAFRAQALTVVSGAIFLSFTLTAIAAGYSVLLAIGIGLAAAYGTQLFYLIGLVLVFGDLATARDQVSARVRQRIERLLGLDIGDLGAVTRGSVDEAMHLELGTLAPSLATSLAREPQNPACASDYADHIRPVSDAGPVGA